MSSSEGDASSGPSIWVDADACPGPVRDILFRAAERTQTPLTLVANKPLRTPGSRVIRALQVPRGFDEADRRIVELVAPGDLVVTGDLPLAAKLLARGARVLEPRGEWIDANTIGERLAVRGLLEGLRESGVATGGPPPLSHADRQAFANRVDAYFADIARRKG
ncbi:MAG: YaiI/YqxD family protein [Burkholderiales bacterium]